MYCTQCTKATLTDMKRNPVYQNNDLAAQACVVDCYCELQIGSVAQSWLSEAINILSQQHAVTQLRNSVTTSLLVHHDDIKHDLHDLVPQESVLGFTPQFSIYAIKFSKHVPHVVNKIVYNCGRCRPLTTCCDAAHCSLPVAVPTQRFLHSRQPAHNAKCCAWLQEHCLLPAATSSV